MIRLVLTTSVLALMAAGAYAADLYVETPMVEAGVAHSGIRGTVEIGALGLSVDQTEAPFEDTSGGAYFSGAIWGDSDNLYWGIDAYADGNTFMSTNEAPAYVGVLGGHLGYKADNFMVGGFVSGGVIPGNSPDDSDGPNPDAYAGFTAGIEGMATFDAVSLFGQLGYADIVSGNENEDDTQFVGPFVRGGAVFSLSDDFAVLADASYGYSEIYDDADDDADDQESGQYWTAGIKGAFRLPTDFDMFVTAGYEYAMFENLGEADGAGEETADTHTVKVGLSVPFGNSTAVDALNPLGTSAQPYRSSSWSNVLE